MAITVHRAHTRGGADYDWLTTRHSFSFAHWHDPKRMGFGALRVLNDDVVAPKRGFDMHAHADFEIVTIVEEGAVTHEDSMGTNARVGAGEVQVMSAGTGVVHGEFNREDEALKLFQIWIEPQTRGVAPRYDQKSFGTEQTLTLLVSGDGRDGSLMIHQDALLYRGNLTAGMSLVHEVGEGRGTYLFVIDGSVTVNGVALEARDAIAVEEEDLALVAPASASFLLIEVPLM
ncbi:MAG TPA: pirin family protein [Candidatus Paceibacterota bacterium]|nr:pirin family protein [Candidatus Paceibacterota bacterium]